MPIDLTGIQNENEFYSDHYLTTVFEGDIKETIERWNELKDHGAKAPHQEFGALATPYIRAATEYRDTRDAAERVQIFRKFAYDLLDALGYQRHLQQPILSDETWLPALYRAKRSDGADYLWIVEALAPAGEDFVTDPLALSFAAELSPSETGELPEHFSGTYEEAVTSGIFGLDQPPRFVLLLSMAQVVLIDRNKWGESRLLRFDLTEIFARKESATMQAVTALLHRESLAPDTGTPLVDAIDEESHRHAHGVSKDLKYALREAIELLGNEAAEQIVARRKSAGETAYQTREGRAALDARQLSLECLRYMYRLLFLFYIEARPDLGFAPMKSDAYRKGYSLESLRELEMMPLTSDEEKDGQFLHESLSLLFALVYEGTPYSNLTSDDEFSRDFDMRPVRTHLFDPDSTPMLSKVRFRNETLQRVIQLMSLSREGQGRRGRISYAQLGINQLGAVYEALLSYSGFFAQMDLYEVKKAGEPNPDPLEAAYFVPKSEIEKYEQDEIVYDDNDPRIYPKGTFIYRLAGRDREDSASYYTPEILTRCLVKYTLKELLKDKTADDILKLTICEPAMGSAAFLVEAVNQLADAYLAKKQEELDERIPHDQYALERQKVRAYITDRNTFGVDFNPIAMELGQVSLWLNCIHEGDFIPWFGDQLFAGNSLIGGRREVYPLSKVGKKAKVEERWFKHAPRQLTKNQPRKADEVYHFLLPDPNMADYKKAVAEPLEPDSFEKLKEWRKAFCAPMDSDELKHLQRLSAVVDELLEENAHALAKERKANTDPITVWGKPEETGEPTDFKTKNRRLAGMRGEGARDAVPYQRLKLAMDYWCSLWFWPLKQADLLPTRDEFLLDMTLILEGNILSSGADIFERDNLLSGADPNKVDLFDHKKIYGLVDIQTLKTRSPRLRVTAQVAEGCRFFHWPVELGDMILMRDAFDVVVGNPPWVLQEWWEEQVLSDFAPIVAIRSMSKPQIQKLKTEILSDAGVATDYLNQYQDREASKSFLKSDMNYPLTAGKPNLYKCFLSLSFKLISAHGIIGMLHPKDHFVDARSRPLIEACHTRLVFLFAFVNQIKSKMFSEIGNTREYSACVYRGTPSDPDYMLISGLFLPSTVDSCFEHDGIGPVPGIKTEAGKWETRGHKSRVVHINEEALKTISSITEEEGFENIRQCRLIEPHSFEILDAIAAISANSNTFSSSKIRYQSDGMWLEGESEARGFVRREPNFPKKDFDAVYSSANIWICNPIFKSVGREARSHRDFSAVDLMAISSDFLPRLAFRREASEEEFHSHIRSVSWDASRKHTDFYRLAIRAQVDQNMERTLISAIFPKGVSHIDSIQSIAFEDVQDLLSAAALFSSLPYDFFIRTSGLSRVRPGALRALPYKRVNALLQSKALILNCLTERYAELWASGLCSMRSGEDQEVVSDLFDHFSFEKAVRSDFQRRQLQIEIDVLACMELGLNLSQLIQIYGTQFPVLRANEQETWYDANGRIVFTTSKGLPEVGLDRNKWEAHKDMADGSVLKTVMDDTMPRGPVERTITYHAPFTLPNREDDYGRAWSVFEPKYATKAAA